RAPSSLQDRSRRRTQSYVAFDLDALFLDRWSQTQLAPEFTGRLVDRKLRRRRDGADVTVRIAEIEELAIQRILNVGDPDASALQAPVFVNERSVVFHLEREMMRQTGPQAPWRVTRQAEECQD